MEKIAVGIDFGTTKTLMSWANPASRKIEFVRLGRGRDDLPTTVHVDESGKWAFGDDADDLLATEPAGYLRGVKRRLGRDDRVVLSGKEWSVREIVGNYLKHITERAKSEVWHGYDIGSVTITVPALYCDKYRRALSDACDLAGLRDISFLEEPVAAGSAYAAFAGDRNLGKSLLVFDWGGGTLDLALLSRHGDRYRIVPGLTGGDELLGGEDIDEALMDFVIKANASLSLKPNATLKSRVRFMKHSLSSRANARTSAVINGTMVDFSLTQEQQKAATGELVERAVACADSITQKAKSAGIPVEGILLIGGSTMMPMVAGALEAKTRLKTRRFDKCIEAVCHGAALASVSGSGQRRPESAAQESPHEDTSAEILQRAEQGDAEAMTQLVWSQLRKTGGIAGADDLHSALMKFARSQSIAVTEKSDTTSSATDELLAWVRKAADRGSPLAKLTWGRLSEDGTLVEKNEQEAYRAYLALYRDRSDVRIDLGEITFRLGLMCLNGRGCRRDLPKGRQYLTEAIERNHPFAKRELGRFLSTLADGTPDDRELGLDYLRALADDDVKAAAILIEALLAAGSPDSRTEALGLAGRWADVGDADMALRAYRMARDASDDVTAWKLLIRHLTLSRDQAPSALADALDWKTLAQATLPENFASTLAWHTRLVEKDLSLGSPVPLLRIRMGELNGQGEDRVAALRLARLLAASGSPEGRVAVAHLLFDSADSTDRHEALAQLKALERQRHPEGLLLLADWELRAGNTDEAVILYEHSANAGEARACLVLAKMYLAGEHVSANETRRKEWFERGERLQQEQNLPEAKMDDYRFGIEMIKISKNPKLAAVFTPHLDKNKLSLARFCMEAQQWERALGLLNEIKNPPPAEVAKCHDALERLRAEELTWQEEGQRVREETVNTGVATFLWIALGLFVGAFVGYFAAKFVISCVFKALRIIYF